MKFKVTYINKNNEKNIEYIEAGNKFEIKNKFENELGFFVVEIESAVNKDNAFFGASAGFKGAAAFDLFMFTRELSILLRSGITMPESLEIIENNTASKKFRKAVNEVRADVMGGTFFSEAVRRRPDFFPETYAKALQGGELSSSMIEVLELLAQNLKKTEKIRTKILNATLYPTVLIIIAINVVLCLMSFVVPSFENVFYEMKIKTPFLTGMFFAFSNFIKNNAFIILLLLFSGVIYITNFAGDKKFKSFMLRLGLKLPVSKTLIEDYLLFTFSGMFAVLMKSSSPVIESVAVTSELLDPLVDYGKRQHLIEDIKSGAQISTAFKNLGLPGGVIGRIAAIGEKSGRLNEMFESISEYYSERIENMAERSSALIEPIAICIIGIFVGMIVLSVFLPLIQIALSNY
ncbi:MAG: type II secretion system F family protein [Candidatus Wallbacteria bacterium]